MLVVYNARAGAVGMGAGLWVKVIHYGVFMVTVYCHAYVLWFIVKTKICVYGLCFGLWFRVIVNSLWLWL